MKERTVDYHGVMVTPETARLLDRDMLIHGCSYLKQDGTRIPAWTLHGFKQDPIVEFRPHDTVEEAAS